MMGMDTRAHIHRAISLLGGPTAAAKVLGVKGYQTVQQWAINGRVPPKYCPMIEQAVGGDVQCEELCPDVDWAYLRGTSIDQEVA